jgi:hypothetical protein
MSSDRASSDHGEHTKEAKAGVTVVTENVYEEGALDPVYQQKAQVLNDALQQIGMGKYQVSL